MMERTRIYRSLIQDAQSKRFDPALLEHVLVRFSLLVAEQRQIQEIEINPLVVCADKILSLDMRVLLHEPDLDMASLPHTAIRPYPTEYMWASVLKDGTPVTIRPIRPEDEPLMIKFHEGLSDRSIYYRYFHMMKLSQRIAHDRLRRICFIDYNREMALVADMKDPQTGEHRILGVGRLTKARGVNEAEFAVLISDSYQGRGLGTMLLRKLIEIGRAEKLARIVAEILHENTEMQYVIERLGFQLHSVVPGQLMKAELTL
jgi:acetyltransferase